MVKNIKNVSIAIVGFLLTGVVSASYGPPPLKGKVVCFTGEEKYVELPFPYIHLSSSGQEGVPDYKRKMGLKYTDGHIFDDSTVYLTESFCALLGRDLKAQSAVVGPLDPCILIAVRNHKEDRALILHRSGFNTMQSVIDALKEIFNLPDKDPENIKIIMFARYNEARESGANPSYITNEKQEAFMRGLEEVFRRFYSSDVTSYFYKNEYEGTYLPLLYAGNTIFVDKYLKLSTTAMCNERIFNYPYQNNGNYLEKYKPCKESYYNKVLFFCHGSGVFEKDENGKSKGHICFADRSKLPKETKFALFPDEYAGLTWLPLIASGLLKNFEEIKKIQEATFVVTPLGKELLDSYKAKG